MRKWMWTLAGLAIPAAFFFGSGISRLSGAPFVDDITGTLLNAAWMPDTAKRYYPRPVADGATSVGVAFRAQEFLRAVKRHIDPLVADRENRAVNYEDLYAVALQIFQDETREIPNPLIAEGLATIKAATAALHEGQDGHVAGNAFASLADRAIDADPRVPHLEHDVRSCLERRVARGGRPRAHRGPCRPSSTRTAGRRASRTPSGPRAGRTSRRSPTRS